MSQLTVLQHRLAAFRHRRQRIRWGMAGSALLVAILGTLAAFFALDVGLELSVAQRVALLALGAAAMVWTIKRFVLPWLGIHETETDVALFVERQHGIDSDLVAALQFDRVASEQWGSRDLQSAIVTRIADLSQQLDVSRGMDYAPLIRRSRLLGATLIVTIAVAAIFPRHVAVFFSRLLLSGRHYPSSTTIETIAVNGAPVWEWNAVSMRPDDTRSAKNRPVTFLIQCSDTLPEGGGIDCRSLQHGTSRPLELRRLTADELAVRLPESTAVDAERSAFYIAEMPRLVEEFEYTLRLGDAWTDAARIHVIEPPLVELSVQVTPPAYAAATSAAQQSPRHLAVLEGSRVELKLQCLNHKPLTRATIKIDSGGAVSAHELVNESGAGLNWSLPADTPLSEVTQEIRYEVQVVDLDKLGLESPLHGLVQLKLDRPPTAIASVVHRMVLPNAKPVIEYRLSDDYGIATAVLQVQVERQSSLAAASSEPTDDTTEDSLTLKTLKIPLDPSPLIGQNPPKRGRYPLDLAPFQLARGDQLKLTLSVVDYRGENPGKQTLSEPILLEISDEAGVLAAITEADERSEKRLSDVIKQQLGVGDGK